MRGFLGKKFWVLAVAAAALLTQTNRGFAAIDPAEITPIGLETSIPFGWVDFCQRHPEECQDNDQVAQDINLTPEALRKISHINLQVNKSIDPITDQDQWGVIDQWDFPSQGRGDCEDYALLKRQKLIESGFPKSALLLTVVKEQNGDGHSVLTLKTDRGDYILDNLNNQVKPWNKTNYRFVKRQSQSSPNIWVAIETGSTVALYGVN
ncbi:MAG: transglutaminase [Methylocystaceae bacterium]|jgi:predicted transglutaminase-like cysteine proteinase|nr:transglutaminase [Methylocystaceae bacterium]